MLSDPTYRRRWKEKKKWYRTMCLTPDGPENDKGERLVTSRNRPDCAIRLQTESGSKFAKSSTFDAHADKHA